MSKKIKQVQAWKFLMEHTNKVQDPLLRKALIADFRERAIRDWGWDPVGTKFIPSSEPELDDWEQDFVNDIKDCATFNLDTRADKRIAELRHAKLNMREFLREGGCLKDIPENIRTIVDLYYKTLFEEGDALMAQIDNLKQGAH